MYWQAVTTSRHEARLSPREHEHQHTVSHHVEIVPRPAIRRRRFDYFGNRTLHFSLEEPHRSLEVVATSVVEVTPLPQPELARTPAWEVVRDRLRADRHRDVLDACEMTFDSPHVKATSELLAYASPTTPPRPTCRRRSGRCWRRAEACARTSRTSASAACARSGWPAATSAATG